MYMNMINVDFNNYVNKALNRIKKGAFLTVKNKAKLNTMTIGWGSFGVIWGKPIIMIMVRKSRFTYKIIESTDNFSISIPFTENMKNELKYCGSYSGKKVNKFEACNLEIIPDKLIETPVIKKCDLFLECKIKYKQQMDNKLLSSKYNKLWYPENDLHTLYFGELLSCYLQDNQEGD